METTVPPMKLPFDSWEHLPSSAVELRLSAELTIEEAEKCSTLRFPAFTMNVDRTTGDLLRPLADRGRLRVDFDGQPELREIVFHLSGRGAVHATPAGAE